MHEMRVAGVKLSGGCCKKRALDIESLQPTKSEALAVTARAEPYTLEIIGISEVLRNGDGVAEVEHGVPPPTGHEDGVTRALEQTDGPEGPSLLHSRHNGGVEVDGLGILSLFAEEVAACLELRDIGRQEVPELVTSERGVPSTRAERVFMQRATTACWPYEEPAVGGSRFFSYKREEVFAPEIRRRLEIVKQGGGVAVESSLEEVER